MSYQVVEGIAGTWWYHLAQGAPFRALCSAMTMPTSIPLSAWGHRGHLNERYCSQCEAIANKAGEWRDGR